MQIWIAIMRLRDELLAASSLFKPSLASSEGGMGVHADLDCNHAPGPSGRQQRPSVCTDSLPGPPALGQQGPVLLKVRMTNPPPPPPLLHCAASHFLS